MNMQLYQIKTLYFSKCTQGGSFPTSKCCHTPLLNKGLFEIHADLWFIFSKAGLKNVFPSLPNCILSWNISLITDDTHSVDISNSVYLINYVYFGGRGMHECRYPWRSEVTGNCKSSIIIHLWCWELILRVSGRAADVLNHWAITPVFK